MPRPTLPSVHRLAVRRLAVCLLASAALALPSGAAAHRMWLLPSVTTLAGTDGWVTFDGAISNDLFNPDHFPLPTANIQVTAPDGSAGSIANAATGRYRSVFDVRIDKPGTWKIWTASEAISGRFKVDGKDWSVGRRGGTDRPNSVASVADIPANATDVQLSQSISRNEVFVTSGTPTTSVFATTGKGLEMVPITHPDDLVADQPARFRFLLDGKPVAGLKVAVVPGNKQFRDAEQAQELTTGADGVLEIRWPVPGFYWLNASHSDDKPSDSRASTRRTSYTTTVEVPAP